VAFKNVNYLYIFFKKKLKTLSHPNFFDLNFSITLSEFDLHSLKKF